MNAYIDTAINNTLGLKGDKAIGVAEGFIDGVRGVVRYEATIDLTCNGDTREFELRSVDITKTSFSADDISDSSSLPIQQPIDLGVNRTTDEQLAWVAKEHANSTINSNKDYLLDNHHDFIIDLGNSLERMEYRNHGVCGYTFLAKDPQKQELLAERDDIEGFRVEFDVGYTLEFFDSSKEELVMKDFIVNGVKALEWTENEDIEMTLTDEEKKVIGERVIGAIQDNFVEAEYYMCEALGGNPIDG